MVRRSKEKEQKEQHINGTENISVKDFTIEDVLYYDQEASRTQGIPCGAAVKPA